MGKTLYLVRHAQAEEPTGQQKDIERQLTSTGERDATRLGNFLAEKSISPGLILSSSATRARETAQIIAERIKYDLDKIKADEELYEASIRILLKTVNETPDKFSDLLLVSHNPSLTFLADYLTAEDLGSMTPATIIGLEFDFESWGMISEKTGTIKLFRSPD